MHSVCQPFFAFFITSQSQYFPGLILQSLTKQRPFTPADRTLSHDSQSIRSSDTASVPRRSQICPRCSSCVIPPLYPSPFSEAVSEAFGLAAGGDVGEPDFVCKGGNKFVATGGEFCGDALFCSCETGKEQQAPAGQRLPPLRRNALRQRAGGANDDRLRSAQEDAKTFLLHRRMKTTDDAAACIAQTGGLIVGVEYGLAGTARGAEERGLGQGEQVEIAKCGDLSRRIVAQTLAQTRRITGVTGVDYSRCHSASVTAARPRRYLIA